MGKRLHARGADPQIIVSSSAKRALRTAEVVAEKLGNIEGRIRVEPELYLASPGKLLDIVSHQDPDMTDVMIVGHNPGLTQLANWLLPSLALANLPTAGVVAIDLDCEAWAELPRARSVLAYYDYPKNTDDIVSRN